MPGLLARCARKVTAEDEKYVDSQQHQREKQVRNLLETELYYPLPRINALGSSETKCSPAKIFSGEVKDLA
jgi:hypothetical protein